MLRENNKILQNIHRVWDICLTATAFIGAYYIRKDWLTDPLRELSQSPNYYALLLLCLIIWYVVFKYTGVYRPYRSRAFTWIAINVARSVAVCVMLLLVFLFLVKEQQISRVFLVIFVMLDVVLLILSKWTLYTVLQYLRKKGYNFHNVLLVGCDAGAGEIFQSIKNRHGAGFNVIGCLSVGDSDNGRGIGDACGPIIGKIEDLPQVLTSHVVDELVFAEPLRHIPEAEQYISAAEQMGVSVHIMPDWGLTRIGFKPRLGSLRAEDIFGVFTLALTTTPDHRPSIVLKSFFDIAAAGLGLAVLAVPFLIVALAIRASSPGPVFYRQERIGQNGRRFTLYKFRTMVDGADEMRDDLQERNESDGPVFKMRKDPRVIPGVGTFLRKTSLDELPQLINVFKGDMSLVGPRPPLPGEIKQYWPDQRRRLSMKPGITCIWQIAPRRNEVPFSEWVRMDLAYIDQWSLWLDFKLLLKTVMVVLTGQGR